MAAARPKWPSGWLYRTLAGELISYALNGRDFGDMPTEEEKSIVKLVNI